MTVKSFSRPDFLLGFNMGILLHAILLAAITLSHFAAAETISEIVVQTQNGPVQGIVQQSRNTNAKFVSFYGLRYADPPPRFEPAKPLTEKWSKTKLANKPGDICIQPPGAGSDDCLFLNVHVPSSALKDSTKKLPVMFWVHGGGLSFGDGHGYGAKYFMENEDVILVTINYRLGIFGFVSMGKEDTAFTANNGLRDMIMALKWVQDNIAAFHGNPDKVTLFGESGGSAACSDLLMSPLAKGLFHRVILQSGVGSTFWGNQRNPRRKAVKLAKALNCPNVEDALNVRKCLESKSGLELLEVQFAVKELWPPNTPIIEFLPTAEEPQKNAFFVKEPSSFYESGKEPNYYNKVPVIIGSTKDEGNLFAAIVAAVPGQVEQLNDNWETLAPRSMYMTNFYHPIENLSKLVKVLRNHYFGKKPITKESLAKFYTDVQMRLPIMKAAIDMTRAGLTVYPFLYSYPEVVCVFERIGIPCLIPGSADHADDIQLLFDHPLFGAEEEIEANSEHKLFSQRLVKIWTSFADTGVPNLSWNDNTTWKPAKVGDDGKVEMDILDIGSTLKKHDTSLFQDQLDFWKKAVKTAMIEENPRKIEL